MTSGPNMYSLANSLANFGGMLAPNFKTPRVVHINLGIQHQFGERSVLSIDYVRQIGTQFPLGIDTNHVGDFTHLDSAAGAGRDQRDGNARRLHGGGVPGRRVAGSGDLLSERGARGQHRRFCPQRPRFRQRLLRSVPVRGRPSKPAFDAESLPPMPPPSAESILTSDRTSCSSPPAGRNTTACTWPSRRPRGKIRCAVCGGWTWECRTRFQNTAAMWPRPMAAAAISRC